MGSKLLREFVEQACPERWGAIVEIINEACKGSGGGFEHDPIDATMEFYALWRLARLYIPRQMGLYDSAAIAVYADALWELCREGLFHIESALNCRVRGRFVDSALWVRAFEWARGEAPRLWDRLDEALGEAVCVS